jgi:hypothetical protein
VGRESEIITINRGEIPNLLMSYKLFDEIINNRKVELSNIDIQNMSNVIININDDKSRTYYLQFMALFLLNERWVFNKL